MEASRHTFKIHSFDTDAFGNLTAPSLLGYLLDASGRSADELGFGISKLQSEKLTWVLARIHIAISEPLRFGDLVEVETWPSGLTRAAFNRDFRIWKGTKEVGQASSIWFVLSLETRLPVRANALVPERLHAPAAKALALSRAVGPLGRDATVQHEFKVRLADIDLNHHVTAASYVAWAVEALPEDDWHRLRFSSIDINFLEECLHGECIITSSVEDGDGARLHRISKKSDGREIARLRTTWESR